MSLPKFAKIGLSNNQLITSRQPVQGPWVPKSLPGGAGMAWQDGRSSLPEGSPSCRVWVPFCLHCTGSSLGWQRVHVWFAEDADYGEHLEGLHRTKTTTHWSIVTTQEFDFHSFSLKPTQYSVCVFAAMLHNAN